MSTKVSIIIATYNRVNYIIDTLRSIQNQTFNDWECIIVDDGSTDDTEKCVREFIKDDPRFKYEIRPAHIQKGANSCRNYGYKKTSGDLIKFFDSDDLMLSNHLEVLVSEVEKNHLDFAVGDCQNFDKNGLRERPYEIDRKTAVMTPHRFALFNVAWITNDLLVRRKFADHLEFAEGIRDQASEYQYNIKLLYLTLNGKLVDQILSHRRIHNDGFVVKALQRPVWFDQMNAELKMTTVQYLEGIAPEENLKWFLSGHIQLNFKLACLHVWPESILSTTSKLIKYHGFFKGILYPLAIFSGYTFGKGYNVIKYIRY